MFRVKGPTSRDKKLVIGLYRECMRVIGKLQPDHQKLWYDYTRLKFQENAQCNAAEVRKLVSNAHEELEWVKSVLQRAGKDPGRPTTPPSM